MVLLIGSCVILIVRGLSITTAQDSDAKQRAVAQMRKIANEVKLCPEHKTSIQNECSIHTYRSGPPTNVEWNVVPSNNVRAPFQGILEFSIPTNTDVTRKTGLSKKLERKCHEEEEIDLQVAASIIEEEKKQGPQFRDGHYRYEFDLGNETPELVKMLWIYTNNQNEVVTTPANAGDSCWVQKAKGM